MPHHTSFEKYQEVILELRIGPKKPRFYRIRRYACLLYMTSCRNLFAFLGRRTMLALLPPLQLPNITSQSQNAKIDF